MSKPAKNQLKKKLRSAGLLSIVVPFYNEEKIIKTLRELLAQDVSIEQIWNDHPDLESAARRYFGGRQAALEAAKLADDGAGD